MDSLFFCKQFVKNPFSPNKVLEGIPSFIQVLYYGYKLNSGIRLRNRWSIAHKKLIASIPRRQKDQLPLICNYCTGSCLDYFPSNKFKYPFNKLIQFFIFLYQKLIRLYLCISMRCRLICFAVNFQLFAYL